MKRRDFIKGTALLAAASGSPEILKAAIKKDGDELAGKENGDEAALAPLITSAPMLQNYAEDSIGISFAVGDLANGYVLIGEKEDLSDARKVKCGGFRVTELSDTVSQIRVTGLKPATRYYYKIGADRIRYKHGYDMKILETVEDPRIYSFATAGKDAVPHFCVINDTHLKWDCMDALTEKIAALAPSCVIWNGDASNNSEDVATQVKIFLDPPIARKDYASEIPYLFTPGNHDNRGMANRHLEKVWMFRQSEERKSRDWDLGRNYAVRMGDIAMIGLDTAEDKLDTNPIFAGLFNSGAYREAQKEWLKDALAQKEITSAPYLVAFCHIPIFDDDPTHNPGDVAPRDYDPQYSADYAFWQRTCSKLWGPLLQEAGCQLVVTAHMHTYRFDPATSERCWAQLVGGGPMMRETNFPTVIEGKTEDGKLKVTVHNVFSGKVEGEFEFAPRKKAKGKKRK